MLFRTDEANKLNSVPNARSSQWKQRLGVSDEEEINYAPRKDWTAEELDKFGYLYSTDPERARGYAKIINDENRKIAETLARHQVAIADKAEIEKSWKNGSLSKLGETISPFEAMTGTQGNYAMQAGNGYKKWKEDKEAQRQLSESESYQRLIEHMTKNNAAGTVEGIAAIPQLLGPDNSQYEPRDEWTDEERNRFGYLYNTNPEAAKAYAGEVNNRYKQQNEEKMKEWVKNNQGLAQLSLLVTDRLGLAEVLNTELTAARDNQLPFTPQITPSEYSELVREVLKEEMYQEDSVSGRVYSAIDSLVNSAYFSYLQKLGGGVFSAVAGATEGYSEGYNSALRDAKKLGLSDEEALKQARRLGKSKAAGELASNYLGDKLPGTNSPKNSMVRGAISEAVGGLINDVLSGNTRYNNLVKDKAEQNMPRNEAEKSADQQLLWQIGSDLLDNLIKGAAYGWGDSDNEIIKNLLKR